MRKYLHLCQVAATIPGPKGTITKQTLYNWCVRGVRGVVLRHRWLGGHIVTTAEWVEEFIDACTAQHAKPKKVQTPKQVAKIRAKALKFLQERNAI